MALLSCQMTHCKKKVLSLQPNMGRTKNMYKQRNADIMQLVSDLRSSGVCKAYIPRDHMAELIYSSQAPRFYISPEKARFYVTQYFRGRIIRTSATKSQMVEDLVEAYKEIVDGEDPDNPMTQQDLWEAVVAHKAKSFYLEKSRIIKIVYNY